MKRLVDVRSSTTAESKLKYRSVPTYSFYQPTYKINVGLNSLISNKFSAVSPPGPITNFGFTYGYNPNIANLPEWYDSQTDGTITVNWDVIPGISYILSINGTNLDKAEVQYVYAQDLTAYLYFRLVDVNITDGTTLTLTATNRGGSISSSIAGPFFD